MLLPLLSHNIYCWAWNRIYVKANGRIPCWCDNGESHTVVQKDFATTDFITEIVNSPEMRQMRLTTIRDNTHYIKECSGCCCLLTQGSPRNARYTDTGIATDVTSQATQAYEEMKKVARLRKWPIGSIDRITEIQLEPSFPCNLKCPGCLHGRHPDPMSTEVGPYLFPIKWFHRIVDSVQEQAIRLDRIAFVGRGEPTLNKHLPEMIAYTRGNLPNIVMSMDSNSTQQFKQEYLLMSWINCSIDGSTKESYDTYRRNGDFYAAIEFMKEAVKKKKELRRTCKIRWKYILFDTTENIELLNKAQEMAKDIGVDELDFVITACGADDSTVNPPQIMNTISIVQDYINNNKIFQNTIVSRS